MKRKLNMFLLMSQIIKLMGRSCNYAIFVIIIEYNFGYPIINQPKISSNQYQLKNIYIITSIFKKITES